ncbi:MAG TPA: hypothetical protein VHY35_20085 [Stellaceae bacterium]|jgi:hypothetical protein|nr:hypothetical protein [Stellaceae bacterium]
MQDDGSGRSERGQFSDDAVWQRSQMTDAAADDAERYLDLAAFADDRLDAEEHEWVATWIASDRNAAGDITAARTLAGPDSAPWDPMPEIMAQRAFALVNGSEHGSAQIIPFPQPQREAPRLAGVARWGSLVAAMVVAGWLGFTLGVDTSHAVAQFGQSNDDGFMHEMLDPSTGFMRDLTEDAQT